MQRNQVDIVPYLSEVRTAVSWKGTAEWGDFLKLIVEDEVLVLGLIIAITDQVVPFFALEPNFTITMYHNFRFFPLYLKAKVAFALAVVLTLQQLLVDRIQAQ